MVTMGHPTYTFEESQNWLEIQVPGFREGTVFEFAIVSVDNYYLGGCGINQIDQINQRANIGYWVRTSATGKGIATAALHCLRDWVFEKTDLIRLEMVIASTNDRSHRVVEKAGAVREGILQRRLILHDISHDATMYSFTRAVPTSPSS